MSLSSSIALSFSGKARVRDGQTTGEKYKYFLPETALDRGCSTFASALEDAAEGGAAAVTSGSTSNMSSSANDAEDFGLGAADAAFPRSSLRRLAMSA